MVLEVFDNHDWWGKKKAEKQMKGFGSSRDSQQNKIILKMNLLPDVGSRVS